MRTESDRSADAAAGQVSAAAAEVYEQFFVPALFGQWVEPVLDAVRPVDGDRLLDIGTGTGVVARAALRRVGPPARLSELIRMTACSPSLSG